MKQFISVKDVVNINALVKKALDYKQQPFMDKTLGANKRIGLLFLNTSECHFPFLGNPSSKIS